jgi:hypothetical protein
MQENQSTPCNLNPYFFTKNQVENQTNKEEDKAKKKEKNRKAFPFQPMESL